MGENGLAPDRSLDLHGTLIVVLRGHDDFVDAGGANDPESNVHVDQSPIAPLEGGVEVIDGPKILYVWQLLNVNVRAHDAMKMLCHASLDVVQPWRARILERLCQDVHGQAHGHLQLEATVPCDGSRIGNSQLVEGMFS